MAGIGGGSRPVRVARPHPVTVAPGGAEQTTPRPASVRTGVKAVLMAWRPGERPAPAMGGSTVTGWQQQLVFDCCTNTWQKINAGVGGSALRGDCSDADRLEQVHR
jgi:hypothetical protein